MLISDTWYRKHEKKKVTFKAGRNETEIDFVLVGKKERKFLRDVKAISWELQHRLIIANVDKRKLKKMVKKNGVLRRRVWKLKESNIRERFVKGVGELVNLDCMDLWKSF